MKPITTLDQYVELTSRYGVKGCRSNNYLLPAEAQRLIGEGKLFATQGRRNACFLIPNAACWRVYYHLNDLAEPVELPNDNYVIEVLFRGNQLPDDEVNYWQENGFTLNLVRDNYEAKYSQLSALSTNDSVLVDAAPTIEDARWAAELFNNTFDHFSGDFIADEQIEPLFAAKQLLVARVNNQLAGALHFYEKNRRYWIGHVAVSESSRGNHVGGSLVNHYIAHCHVDDNTRYALWVQRLNQAAVSMYQACGFKYTNRSSLSLIKQK